MKGLDLGEFKRWWQLRPAREKLMLFACSLGVVLALGDSLAISPIEKRLRQARGAEEQLQGRWDQLQSRRKGQSAQDKEMHTLEDSLRARLQAAQARMALQAQQMADTAQLPEVLRSVVATMGTTRLLELAFNDDATAAAPAAPAPTPVAAASSSGGPAAAGWSAPRVYHLPVTLKVSGSWTELSGLLSQIENRAPALQWQALGLDSGEWPAIQLTLRAHVRSLQPRWGSGP